MYYADLFLQPGAIPVGTTGMGFRAVFLWARLHKRCPEGAIAKLKGQGLAATGGEPPFFYNLPNGP